LDFGKQVPDSEHTVVKAMPMRNNNNKREKETEKCVLEMAMMTVEKEKAKLLRRKDGE
jgi:hypothetical protein